MADSSIKNSFLEDIESRLGSLSKIGESQSLFSVNQDTFRIYIRYSKLHNGYRAFLGLRAKDLQDLQGRLSFICLLWDGQEQPLVLPFSDFEEIFSNVEPANDGQYKVQVFLQQYGTELYIAGAGRFNVDGYFGFEELEKQVQSTVSKTDLELTHNQVQTLLGMIGSLKGYQIWIPTNDGDNLDRSLVPRQFEISISLPNYDWRTYCEKE